MFKKLHLQLTIFCTFVTSLIMIVMMCICLYILQADASRQSFLSFEKNVVSMISYLESQQVLSHRWLRELENNSHFLISIFDGDTPLFFNSLNDYEDKNRLFQMAGEQATEKLGEISQDSLGSLPQSQNVCFTLHAKQEYYASVAAVAGKSRPLHVITLYSLEDEQRVAKRQQIVFCSAVLTAIVLFALFSWYFTGRVLAPIEKSRRRQTEFVAAASHELRAPLTVILSSLSAMKQAPEPKQQLFANHIQEEGQRMKRLIGDMLSLANADNNHWSFYPSVVEPDTLLLEVYERYQPRACEKGIRLDIHLPESAVIPQKWDADRMAQVLEILLDNALSYTPSGGCIQMSLFQKRDYTQYRVTDNGPGIPDDKKAAVFQRFYRADPSHHDKNHFGLGLCIAEEIVRMHKGKIHVEDAPGGGAAFCITIVSQKSTKFKTGTGFHTVL